MNVHLRALARVDHTVNPPSNWTKRVRHNILRTMIGRMLAFIALLTGLVAVNAPAHGAMVDALEYEIGVAVDAADDSADDRRPCRYGESGSYADEADKTEKPSQRRRVVLCPPVLYGIDRAYE